MQGLCYKSNILTSNINLKNILVFSFAKACELTLTVFPYKLFVSFVNGNRYPSTINNTHRSCYTVVRVFSCLTFLVFVFVSQAPFYINAHQLFLSFKKVDMTPLKSHSFPFTSLLFYCKILKYHRTTRKNNLSVLSLLQDNLITFLFIAEITRMLQFP